MNYTVDDRAAELGEYIITNNATVRSTAKAFGISKSTVHTDVSQRLKKSDYALYLKVRRVLDENKAHLCPAIICSHRDCKNCDFSITGLISP